MPTKLKKSTKTYSRQTGKTTIEHYYMRSMKEDEMIKYLEDPNGKAKIKQKIRNELTRRSKVNA